MYKPKNIALSCQQQKNMTKNSTTGIAIEIK